MLDDFDLTLTFIWSWRTKSDFFSLVSIVIQVMVIFSSTLTHKWFPHINKEKKFSDARASRWLLLNLAIVQIKLGTKEQLYADGGACVMFWYQILLTIFLSHFTYVVSISIDLTRVICNSKLNGTLLESVQWCKKACHVT